MPKIGGGVNVKIVILTRKTPRIRWTWGEIGCEAGEGCETMRAEEVNKAGRFPMGKRCGSVGGARCAHRNKKRNARMRRAGMHAMRRLLWPMRTLMMLAR